MLNYAQVCGFSASVTFYRFFVCFGQCYRDISHATVRPKSKLMMSSSPLSANYSRKSKKKKGQPSPRSVARVRRRCFQVLTASPGWQSSLWPSFGRLGQPHCLRRLSRGPRLQKRQGLFLRRPVPSLLRGVKIIGNVLNATFSAL